jgi:hypothetical protein
VPRNQRSRKRGQRRKPSTGRASTPPRAADSKPAGERATPAPAEPPGPESIGGWRVEPRMTRSQRRDAEIRAGLTPIGPGERPGAIIAGAIISLLVGAGQLIAFVAGLKIHGKTPAAGGTVLLSVLLIVCAIGMWRLWYGAVLGFMALLAIVTVLFALLLIEASNVLGFVVAIIVVAGCGYLFFKLVRVLSRIQMPRYPGR